MAAEQPKFITPVLSCGDAAWLFSVLLLWQIDCSPVLPSCLIKEKCDVERPCFNLPHFTANSISAPSGLFCLPRIFAAPKSYFNPDVFPSLLWPSGDFIVITGKNNTIKSFGKQFIKKNLVSIVLLFFFPSFFFLTLFVSFLTFSERLWKRIQNRLKREQKVEEEM